ncbi:DUF1853 family protein [Herbaspirillum sp. LeCh32-8]|uniref:DUF1853 family protein n=1 Tax=Herbaspirillum sp. LeCh32-8 TaxID=2821356 RepID=UPI001AE910FA|nr:DUF1853 family protein [Herbaspirillum sp. LeCh32-8]MBP0597074.1 DUF1853 family protein [Herbaspirillum sp. LeCh32-8]
MQDGSVMPAGGDYQRRFQRRWPRLRDPHVRALAWLLDAPDLMASDAPCWENRIATLGPVSDEVAAWLNRLQDDPELNAALQAHMAHQPSARLGRYAEKLLGFYLVRQRQLVAANLQVRNTGATRETLGEFDFLVKRPHVDAGAGLEHWEFATKFYLLEQAPSSSGAGVEADAFVGPNLADSLGRKMRKIMSQQLMLSRHPAAAAVLPEPVAAAQALVKGWLFYRDGMPAAAPAIGIAHDHCRGFWCDAAQLQARTFPEDASFVVMPRLEWLAPLRAEAGHALALPALLTELQARFAVEEAPVMVAVCRPSDEGEVVEAERGFIVPDGWQQRAAQTVRHAVVRV